MHLRFSIGLIVFWAAAIIGLYWAYNTVLFAPLLILIPGLKCLLDTYMIEPLLKKYEPIALSAAESKAGAENEESAEEEITEEVKEDEEVKS